MKKSLLLISLLAATGAASAADLFQHPAVFSPRALPSVDVNTFIVGHPAHGFAGQAPQEASRQPVAAEKTPQRAAESEKVAITAQASRQQ